MALRARRFAARNEPPGGESAPEAFRKRKSQPLRDMALRARRFAARNEPPCGESAPEAFRKRKSQPLRELAFARPERFELPTFGSVDRRSIQLSYGRLGVRLVSRLNTRASKIASPEPTTATQSELRKYFIGEHQV
jgi:hypothetical protein